MIKTKRAFLRTIVPTGIALALTALPAFAQDFLGQSAMLYSVGSADQLSIVTAGWGSGEVKASTQMQYNGGKALEVASRNLYSGARFDFKNTVDLTPAMGNANTYLQIDICFTGQSTGGTRGLGGMPGGMPAIPGMGGAGLPGAMPNARGAATRRNATGGMPGMPGMPGMGGIPGIGGRPGIGGYSATQQVPERLRVALFFADGQSAEAQINLLGLPMQSDGWMTVAVPFAAFKGKPNPNGYKLSRMVVGASGVDKFYIGDIVSSVDSTPLQPSAGEDREIARYDTVTFEATCDSGLTATDLSWDFDDSDGIQEEAVGRVISHQFRKSGEFKVTLTATDPFGVKQMAKNVINVKVNQ